MKVVVEPKRFVVMRWVAPDTPWEAAEYDSYAEAEAALAQAQNHGGSYKRSDPNRPYLVQRW